MSGGRYNYAYRQLEDFAAALSEKGGCYAAPTARRRAFAAHCRRVAAAMKACEWNDSGDGDKDERKLIEAVLAKGAVDEAARVQLVEAADAVLRALVEGAKP